MHDATLEQLHLWLRYDVDAVLYIYYYMHIKLIKARDRVPNSRLLSNRGR